MASLTPCIQSLAHLSTPSTENSSNLASASSAVDARVAVYAQGAIGSSAAALMEGSYMSDAGMGSLFAEFGLGPKPGQEEPACYERFSSEDERWIRAYEGGGVALCASAVALPTKASSKPRRVTFSPDCKDERSSDKWKARRAVELASKKRETFDSLSIPYPSQDQITKLLENQLSLELWNKNYCTRYSRDQSRYFDDRGSLGCITAAFNDLLNGAAEEVVRDERIESGIAYIRKHLDAYLEKSFLCEEEVTLEFLLKHNGDVLALCKPIINAILEKPSACRVLETFFRENLEGELARRR